MSVAAPPAPKPAAAPTPPDRRHIPFALVIGVLLAAGLLWGGWRLATADRGAWQQAGAEAAMNRTLGALPGQSGWTRWGAGLRWRLLGDLGPQVAEGCPGWLFYRDGLRPAAGEAVAAAAYARRLALMRHWAQRLRAHGVQLVVATVPDKSRIEAAHLCGLPVSATMQARLDDWQQRLAAAGVRHVDLRPALTDLPQPYYRTDVHMAPEGAEAAAAAIGRTALPLLGGPGGQRFDDQRGAAPEPRMGDLIVLAGLEHLPEGWRPSLESFVPERIVPVASGGLLDAGPPAEVLLVGDSNGLRSEFPGRLGRQLGREVWTLSHDGGYFSGAMLAALAQQDRWPASLKLVVWTFSELSLSLPLSADEARAAAALP
ncbi:cell division protein FtsQ [Pseudacidovorax sp. RU35E]|uniref:alginate O-acetyltransferase AlgX-related protein n=1 Tax=Pseudacidovorax sp. RU35E TaxID=1907403 RepID=UPI000954E99F|nr:cell division protein FtsQ [Pseudacidovorax sp. RU35E]SIR40087.1 alginate O-acetyltransferase complex protein AlgJ [Pseudacidovorax sp. RU35E]